MAHKLEIRKGQAQMFSVGETPWHGLGKVLEAAPNSAEAIKLAGLDWAVEMMSMETQQGGITVPNHRAVLRTSDCKVLGVVGRRFHPLQNKDAFSFFDPFIESGEATYETAGCLKGGARVWIQAKLNIDPISIVGEDIVEKYALLSNGHDGTLITRLGWTNRRVVCQNTLTDAHTNENSKLLRVRHTASNVNNLMAIRETMDMVKAEFIATAEKYRALARRDINKKDLEKYVCQVFGKPVPTDDEETPSAPNKAFTAIERLMEEGRGSDLPGVRGTVWGAYQATNEYLNWEKGREAETRINSLWYGEGAKQDAAALQYAYVLAGVQ